MFRIMITKINNSTIVLVKFNNRFFKYLSHALNVQLAIINRESIKTSKTVPGHIVINVFNTNLVLNLIRLKAPILLDEASLEKTKNEFFSLLIKKEKNQPVNNLLCRSMTRHIK
jgi:hypothetical protein